MLAFRDASTGWRRGLLINVSMAAAVLLVNIAFLAVTESRYRSLEGGQKPLYEGSCATTETASTLCHLFINALSTLLLSASNYTMQVLAAPTRKEIDKAHRQQKVLYIGMQSLQNFKSITRSRVILWGLLLASSVPLHLIYNSVVSSLINANYYEVMVVSSEFEKEKPFEVSALNDVKNSSLMYGIFPDTGVHLPRTDMQDFLEVVVPKVNTSHSNLLLSALQEKAFAEELERMNVSECIAAYKVRLQQRYRNVLAVTGNLDQSNSAFWIEGSDPKRFTSNDWTCMYTWGSRETTISWGESVGAGNAYKAHCNDDWMEDKPDHPFRWSIGYYGQADLDDSSSMLTSYPISYCLVEKADSAAPCSLVTSPWLLTAVIIANGVKVLLMAITLMYKRPTLVTIGDGIASFLETPDATTVGMCLATEHDFKQAAQKSTWHPKPQIFQRDKARVRWFASSPSKLWLATLGVYIVFICTIVTIFFLNQNHDSKFDLPFYTGSAEQAQSITIGMGMGTVPAIVVANIPQMAVSVAYLLYNRVISAMASYREWASFAQPSAAKSLRTSRPVGSQRSTYWLQLPYRFAIPLIIMSGTIHYFTSQSLYYSNLRIYANVGNHITKEKLSGLGYNKKSMECLIICIAVMFGAAVIMGTFTTKQSGIPNFRFCSATISAACHRPKWDDKAHEKKITWGALKLESDLTTNTENIGHCCFTSRKTRTLREGKKYM